MASNSNRISLYLAMAGFWCALLFALLTAFADLERERRHFTEFAAAIHGRLSAEAHRARDAVRDLAAFVEIAGGTDRSNAPAYARRIIERNSGILMFGLVWEKLSVPVPGGFVAPDAELTGGRWEREVDGVFHITALAEAPGSRRMLSFDAAAMAALGETVQRARLARSSAAGRIFVHDGWGRIRWLVQRVAQDGREAFVMAACKVSGVPAGDRKHLSAALLESDRLAGPPVRVWLRVPAAESAAASFARALFPPLHFRRELAGPQPAPLLEVEQFLDWSCLDGKRLGTLLALAGLCLLAVVAQERALELRERRVLEEGNRLFRLANFDALTELPNRQLFYNRLERALASARRTGQRHAVLYLDLDGFKQVNDFFGHDVGDKVLQQAGRIFLNRVRETDTVARLGGDEFVILLCGINGRRAAELVADKIKGAFCRPVGLAGGGKSLPVVGASVGIALYPEDGETAAELLRAADRSMYRDKAGSRGHSYPVTMAS